jgi:hypothetical protein
MSVTQSEKMKLADQDEREGPIDGIAAQRKGTALDNGGGPVGGANASIEVADNICTRR